MGMNATVSDIHIWGPYRNYEDEARFEYGRRTSHRPNAGDCRRDGGTFVVAVGGNRSGDSLVLGQSSKHQDPSSREDPNINLQLVMTQGIDRLMGFIVGAESKQEPCVLLERCHYRFRVPLFTIAMRTSILLIAALVAGAAGGYLAGRNTTPPRTQTSSSTNAVVASHQRGRSNRAVADQTDSAPFQPDELAAQLRKLSSVSWRKRWEQARDIARSILPKDASNALAMAEKILSRQEWYNFRYQVLQKWAEADPLAVLAYGQSLKNRSEALQEWGKREPDAAMAWAEKQPRGQERQNFLSAVLNGLAEGDPAKALEKLNNAPFYQRRWIRDQIIDTLAQTDPKQAAELALKNDRNSSRYGYGFPGEGALGNVLQKWMAQDADAAVSWVQSQPENVRKRRSVLNAVQALGGQDPAAAMRVIELVPPGQQREETLGNLLSNWANRDLDALRAWTDSRTDAREKSLGQIAYAQGLGPTDPAAAASSLQNVHADERHSWAFQQVFNEYAQRDPQAAVAMAQSLTDSAGRNQAISGALAGWAQLDPQSAANFAMTLPGGPTRNNAISDMNYHGTADRIQQISFYFARRGRILTLPP